MKFATLSISGLPVPAIVDEQRGRFWPVSELAPDFRGDLVDLVAAYATLKDQLVPKTEGQALKGVKLLAPISHPRRNIFCVGKNYLEHAAEFSKSGFDSSAKEGEHAPEAPVVFTKPFSSVIGPGDTIPSHPHVTQLDYEAELTIVIGKAGRAIKKADALEHVFGYTIVNDVTARDLQKRHRQWFLGKGLDGFCPMGPCIVTADELDAAKLAVKCWVNGELRQDANTTDLIFDIPTLIEAISAGIELQPGDLIATGTPAGVGIGFNPPRFLSSGDVVRIEIQNIGVLENTVG
ncbi:MAG: fumarylacetoacetate hydrolase family protein [Gammaproteobacteria bacterium]|nr:fumarylacetoacetate hydrolase family protein [Gammaproteobacteria bacterium]MBU1440741.1 fumarylacetoacetate hydrolase family protein [Gammaproteobacteria bacterium]MBU2285197.1 fumarylacetoacetate hydrolase family protein [Gammaproteobacteria bacterium]MBU2408932.1 fumarylacetoacetate hydrolase family protein [Gammaproteobacteria bacterium]